MTKKIIKVVNKKLKHWMTNKKLVKIQMMNKKFLMKNMTRMNKQTLVIKQIPIKMIIRKNKLIKIHNKTMIHKVIIN